MIKLIESIDGKILRIEEYDGKYGNIVVPFFDLFTIYQVGDLFWYRDTVFEVKEREL